MNEFEGERQEELGLQECIERGFREGNDATVDEDDEDDGREYCSCCFKLYSPVTSSLSFPRSWGDSDLNNKELSLVHVDGTEHFQPICSDFSKIFSPLHIPQSACHLRIWVVCIFSESCLMSLAGQFLLWHCIM